MRPSVAEPTAWAAALGVRLRTAPTTLLLAPLVAVQLLAAAWFALRTPHNGFVWYSGGDATEYWTGQWAVGHLLLPQAVIGWGLPVLYAWVPLVAGTTLLNGLPVIVALQAILLVPLALVLFFGLADRLYGRTFALWATVLWVSAPWLLLLGFRDHAYREAFAQEVLAPHWYGLTNMADFPSLVLVLACALTLLRAVDGGRTRDAVLAGLLGGLLIGVKPANAFFLAAAVVLVAAARRPRVALVYALAMVPALVALTIWKARGLGHVPITSAYSQAHEALGPAPAPLAASVGNYIPWSPAHLGQELRDLNGVFWSVRLLEYLAIAGAVGAVRRAPARGLFVATWFAAYMVVKGSSGHASVSDTSYFRLTLPGLPAFVLLAASVVFLAPRLGRRLVAAARPTRRLPTRAVTLVAIAVAVAPLAVVLSLSSAATPRFARDNLTSNDAPISDALRVTARPAGARVRLSWAAVGGGHATVHYVVYRAQRGTDGCTLPPSGARECYLTYDEAAPVPGTSALVARSRATYRVGAVANNRATVNTSDLMLLGPPVTVRGG